VLPAPKFARCRSLGLAVLHIGRRGDTSPLGGLLYGNLSCYMAT
jgi:hypothetical protein